MTQSHINNYKWTKTFLSLFLLTLFIVQHFFISPPKQDYFNINLNIVSGVVILFSLILTSLSIYNYKNLNSFNLEFIDKQHDDVKESYIQTWAPVSGGCLISQLVYFHIYGHISLIITSIITFVILLLILIKT